MNVELVRNLIAGFNEDDADSIELKMVQKVGDGLRVFQPTIERRMRGELKDYFVDVLQNNFYLQEQEDYNPNIVVDGALQVSDCETAHINQVIEELTNEDNFEDDLGELTIQNINYYCFVFRNNNQTVYLFRRFTKMKKMRNGILGRIQDNSLRRIEARDFFGIDRDIDIIVFENEALIINRFALQTIFRLDDYFNQQAQQALELISDNNIIENFDVFQNDCLNDKLAARRMTKILNTEGRLEGFFDNIDNLPDVIENFDLEIELNNDNRIMYNGSREARSQILFCISDAYYQSFILRRLGEDIS